MLSLVAPRLRAGLWTSLLALALTFVQACRSSAPPDESANKGGVEHATQTVPNQGSGESAPPIVRGRARWFTQPTTNPPQSGLVSFDVWETDSTQSASANQFQIYWQIVSGPPSYPTDPQFQVMRTLGTGTPLDWYENNIFANGAYIADVTNPKIQVQVYVTDSSNKVWKFHQLLPVDTNWYVFD